MSGMKITTGTKLWRFRHLPADLHLRAKALAAYTTQTTHLWTSVEDTMIKALAAGLDALERQGRVAFNTPPPSGSSVDIITRPPPYQPLQGAEYEGLDEPCDWRPPE